MAGMTASRPYIGVVRRFRNIHTRLTSWPGAQNMYPFHMDPYNMWSSQFVSVCCRVYMYIVGLDRVDPRVVSTIKDACQHTHTHTHTHINGAWNDVGRISCDCKYFIYSYIYMCTYLYNTLIEPHFALMMVLPSHISIYIYVRLMFSFLGSGCVRFKCMSGGCSV